MRHSYGLPYKGSKNSIAERVVKCLPSGGRFLDACCGGGAISHAAYLSGRYASVTGYDINKSIITLLDAVMVHPHTGLIDYEHFPIVTKEMFYEAKERWDDGNLQDAVIRYIASFGFNGQDYQWGEERLPYKYLLMELVCGDNKFKRRDALRNFINLLISARLPYDSNEFKNLAGLEQLNNLQRMSMIEDEMFAAQSISSTNIGFHVGSIFDINYEDFDIIYFDPPYASAQKRYNHLDFSQIMFKALLRALIEAGKTVFVSEYDNPDAENFIKVASFKKVSTQAASGNYSVTERVFFGGNRETYEKLTNIKIGSSEEEDQSDELCDDSEGDVGPATGGEQCPETDAGIDQTNLNNPTTIGDEK